jgi:hypothetical protein
LTSPSARKSLGEFIEQQAPALNQDPPAQHAYLCALENRELLATWLLSVQRIAEA